MRTWILIGCIIISDAINHNQTFDPIFGYTIVGLFVLGVIFDISDFINK